MIEIRAEHEPDRETVTVSGSLTVEHASEVGTALHDALKRKAGSVVLKLGAITKADLTFFQVVCSAHKTATAAGKSFRIEQFKQDVIAEAHGAMGFARKTGCSLDKAKTCVFMLMGA